MAAAAAAMAAAAAAVFSGGGCSSGGGGDGSGSLSGGNGSRAEVGQRQQWHVAMGCKWCFLAPMTMKLHSTTMICECIPLA